MRSWVCGARFSYPSHVIDPDVLQDGLYDAFMPPRIQGFLDGVNVIPPRATHAALTRWKAGERRC